MHAGFIHTTVDSHYSARDHELLQCMLLVGGAGDTVRSGSDWIMDRYTPTQLLVMQRLWAE